MNESWRDKFNTKLDPKNEKMFQAWIEETKSKYGVDLTPDLDTYDLRGYWLDGGYKDENFRQRMGHAPDTYKKPNHPTFSRESIYSSGDYEGGDWLSETEFAPSLKMLKTTHPILQLHDYLRKYGEGVRLVLPNESAKRAYK